jgi:uncharacterized protein (DUF2267 family)
MGYESLVSKVELIGGFDRRDDAERAIAATLEVLGQRLTDSEAQALARALPSKIAVHLRRRGYEGDFGVPELVTRVARKERVSVAFAREHVGAVLGAVGDALPAETATRLRKALPPAMWELFEVRRFPEVEVPPYPSDGAFARSVAVGRPGSRRPISEARDDRAQAESVARSENPHGETKLSSARGTTQEREAETLASGRPRRPK